MYTIRAEILIKGNILIGNSQKIVVKQIVTHPIDPPIKGVLGIGSYAKTYIYFP